MTARYQYLGCCVHLDGDAINAMKDAAREICLSDFTRAVSWNGFKDLQRDLGYSRLNRIERDWHISFNLSTYNGRPCAYVVHSAIEYVFVEAK